VKMWTIKIVIVYDKLFIAWLFNTYDISAKHVVSLFCFFLYNSTNVKKYKLYHFVWLISIYSFWTIHALRMNTLCITKTIGKAYVNLSCTKCVLLRNSILCTSYYSRYTAYVKYTFSIYFTFIKYVNLQY